MILGQLKAEKEVAKTKENSFNPAQWKLSNLFRPKPKTNLKTECLTEIYYQRMPKGYKNTIVCHSPLMEYYDKGIVVSRNYEASIEYSYGAGECKIEKNSESIPLEKIITKISYLIEGIEKRRQSHKEFTGQELNMPKIVLLPTEIFGCIVYAEFVDASVVASVSGDTVFVNASKLLSIEKTGIKNIGNHEMGHFRELPITAGDTGKSFVYEILNEYWTRKDISTNQGGYPSEFKLFQKFISETKKRLGVDSNYPGFDLLLKRWYINGPAEAAYYLDKAWGQDTTWKLLQCESQEDFYKLMNGLLKN